MKKKTKILIGIAFTLTLLSLLAVSSFASEEIQSAAEEVGVFAEIYAYLYANADKIFSLLAFIGALIISFSYKKGLFPFVEKGLSALAASVKSLREETEKNKIDKESFMDEVAKALSESENALNASLEKLSSLEAELAKAALIGKKTEEFRQVLLAEVEMIYDIFTSSSLPQYQKDKVGEAYLRMKRSLDGQEE